MPRFEQNEAQISGSNSPTLKTVAVVSGWLVPENQAMPVLFEHVVGRVQDLCDVQGSRPQLQRNDTCWD